MAYDCTKCKYREKDVSGWPCNECLEILYTHFEEKETVIHKDNSPWFGPNMMRQEEFKIPDDILVIIDQNKKPNLVIPQLDGIEKKIIDFAKAEKAAYDALTSNLNCIQSTANTIKSHQINLEKANHAIEEKIDKLTEALESVNSKLDILDQRIRDFRQHQILKDMKCVTQVKPTKQNPFKIPEPKFNIGDIVVYKGYNIKYKITDRGYNLSQKIWTYDFERSDNDKIVRSSREDRIELAKKEQKKDILVREEKLNPDDYAKFKVGDKVKLKHGKVVYTVKKVHASKLMPSERIFIRYTLSREGRKTDQSEYENRLTKA